ncbi:hypothetical protein [Morganella morganii]|uniref:hypothetical protein n=2 Tax=Morganella morganii TaxID=582 RepID=UPI0031A5AF61
MTPDEQKKYVDILDSIVSDMEDIGYTAYLGGKRTIHRTSYMFLHREDLGDMYDEIRDATYEEFGKKTKEEDERVINLIWEIVRNPDVIINAVEIIINDLINSSSEERKKKIEQYAETTKKIANPLIQKQLIKKMVVYVIAYVIAQKIIKDITKNVVVKRFITWQLSALTTYGLFEQMIMASDRLKVKYPRLYLKLKPDNLDLTYFFIEPHMGGLIDLYYYGNDTADMDKLIIDNLDGLLSNGQ